MGVKKVRGWRVVGLWVVPISAIVVACGETGGSGQSPIPSQALAGTLLAYNGDTAVAIDAPGFYVVSYLVGDGPGCDYSLDLVSDAGLIAHVRTVQAPSGIVMATPRFPEPSRTGVDPLSQSTKGAIALKLGASGQWHVQATGSHVCPWELGITKNGRPPQSLP
jgi:hypothetical protein